MATPKLLPWTNQESTAANMTRVPSRVIFPPKLKLERLLATVAPSTTRTLAELERRGGTEVDSGGYFLQMRVAARSGGPVRAQNDKGSLLFNTRKTTKATR